MKPISDDPHRFLESQVMLLTHHGVSHRHLQAYLNEFVSD